LPLLFRFMLGQNVTGLGIDHDICLRPDC
jgi:hypothetical protein